MDLNSFNRLETNKLSQNIVEWQIFLEWIDSYFKNRKINRPIVVELGTWFNQQKNYYEQLFNAEHIGVDIQRNKAVPDILGDTHDKKTMQELKVKLNGRLINLLFIDANHNYQDVKQDYETYEPLTKNIIAFHDIITERAEVRLFWDEISRHQEYITETICAPAKYFAGKVSVGIGLVIKEW